MRILLVDDEASLRTLLRLTFEAVDVEVEEAESAAAAEAAIRGEPPDVVVLDVHMPGRNGVSFCRELKSNRATRDIPVVLLTGSGGESLDSAGADAVMLKPFSPLELLAAVERLAGGMHPVPFRASKSGTSEQQQLMLYARDLRHLLEVERSQRVLLEQAYRDTVAALATALESKDIGTRKHSQRVHRYASELARLLEPDLIDEPSTEYGFLLHDVGKIGIPDKILQKRAPLNEVERRVMKMHTVLGEQMLGNVSFLQGEGIRVVRSHHERWDGTGYPDGLGGSEIPVGARVFAVADTLDAITSDRPYRTAQPFDAARNEIELESGRQFDPGVVEAFSVCEPELREIHREFATVE